MPTIRVDDAVFKELQKRAQPFVDTPNDVLRRVLELEAAPRGRSAGRRGKVGRTPDSAYRLPILKALGELGGKARADEVLAAVHEQLKGELKEADYEPMQSGQTRWQSAAGFERLHMARLEPPLIKPDSPRGVWELTKDGRLYLQTRLRAK